MEFEVLSHMLVNMSVQKERFCGYKGSKTALKSCKPLFWEDVGSIPISSGKSATAWGPFTYYVTFRVGGTEIL